MQRTNTTGLTTFDLPGPNAAIFTFLSLARWMEVLKEMEEEGEGTVDEYFSQPQPSGRAMRICIPPSSNWHMIRHWHPSQNGYSKSLIVAPPTSCRCVTCVEGRMSAGNIGAPHSNRATTLNAGSSVPFTKGARVSWSRYDLKSNSSKEPSQLVVDLIANQILWRNVCSAILDRDRFPELSSTPWWCKQIYKRFFSHNEDRREWFLDWLLSLQLQCIYYAHDFHTDHGMFVSAMAFFVLMPFSQPPRWARNFDWKSAQITAWITMSVITWFCHLFLGMKGQYAEYSAVPSVKELKDGEKEALLG